MCANLSIQVVEKHLEKICKFITPFLPMTNCHMVTYITDQLWKNYTPNSIQQEIKTKLDVENAINIYWNHLNDIQENHSIDYKELRLYLAETQANTVDKLNDVWISPEELKKKLDYGSKGASNIKGCMSEKKNHEVEITADVIASICERENLFVVDAGDGKGYLSTRLSLEHDMRVLGVDYNPSNTFNALKRAEMLDRKWNSFKAQAQVQLEGSLPASQKQSRRRRKKQEQIDQSIANELPKSNENYKTITHFITCKTDFPKLFRENFTIDATPFPGICLTGLHTCGNLAPSCLRIYNTSEHVMALCNIGCCYHLMSEQFSTFNYERIRRKRDSSSKSPERCNPDIPIDELNFYGFPMSEYLIKQNFALGRNARMLACQSIYRVIEQKGLPHIHLFYRALLEVLIKQKFSQYENRIEVGKIKKCSTFAEYVRKSVKRNPCLNFDDITDDQLNQLPQQYAQDELYLHIFYLLRLSLAPIIETIILLDRLLYLMDADGNKRKSFLVKFFDSVISPRCYGLISIK